MIKKYTLESFSESTGISNVMKVVRKSVPGGQTGVEKTTFSKSGFTDHHVEANDEIIYTMNSRH